MAVVVCRYGNLVLTFRSHTKRKKGFSEISTKQCFSTTDSKIRVSVLESVVEKHLMLLVETKVKMTLFIPTGKFVLQKHPFTNTHT